MPVPQDAPELADVLNESGRAAQTARGNFEEGMDAVPARFAAALIIRGVAPIRAEEYARFQKKEIRRAREALNDAVAALDTAQDIVADMQSEVHRASAAGPGFGV